MRNRPARNAIAQAIKIAGGQSELARRTGLRQQQISYWLNKSVKGLPDYAVIAIEKATGVPKEQLRPVLFAQERVAS